MSQLGLWMSGFRAKNSDSGRLFALAMLVQNCPGVTTTILVQPDSGPGAGAAVAALATQAYTHMPRMHVIYLLQVEQCDA